MDTRQIVNLHVLHCQTSLLDHLLGSGTVVDDAAFDDEILEWWLVSSWLARQLEDIGETVITEFGCSWWGRTTSGQALYLDEPIERIASE